MKKLLTFSLMLLGIVTFFKGVLQATPQPVASIPFEMQQQHMFFQLKIKNSRPLNFIFDTGASMMVINPHTAKELGLSSSGSMSVQGVGGFVTAPRFTGIPLTLGHTKIRTNAIGFEVTHLETRLGKKIDGIIGADYMWRYVVQLNYDQKEIRFFDFEDFNYTGKGQKIKLKMRGRLVTCKVAVKLPSGEKLKDDFLVDTGAGHCLGFTTFFTDQNQLSAKLNKKYRYYTSGATTNKTYLEVGRLPQIKLGNHIFKSLPVSLSKTRKGVLGTFQLGGILGNRILKRFNITFNYQTRSSYWEPNQGYTQPFRQNCVGLALGFTKNLQQVIVTQIIEGSPAAKNGLQKDDILLEINGKKVQPKKIMWLKKQMGKPGKKIHLKIKRDKKIKTFEFKQEALI